MNVLSGLLSGESSVLVCRGSHSHCPHAALPLCVPAVVGKQGWRESSLLFPRLRVRGSTLTETAHPGRAPR